MTREPDRAPTGRAAAGPAPGVLAGGLLALADALDLLLAVKEIDSGRYLHLNAPMAAWLGGAGTAPAALLGRTDAELYDAAVCASLRAAEQEATASSGAQRSEHRFERGGERREFTVVRQVLAPDGSDDAPRALLALWTETTRERQAADRLQHALAQLETQQKQQAEAPARQELPAQPDLRDAVTGLYHFAHFDDQLRREIDLSLREHREFALVAVILDPLGEEALGLGAAARSRFIDTVGRLLAGNTRAMDSACRVADGRFAILLSGVGLATAHSRMEGLRRQCATQIVVHEGRALGFTVSMGVASFPHTAATRQELLDAADAALAQAQRRGGNHVSLASIRFEPL